MPTSRTLDVESQMQAFWTRILDETLEDARKDKHDSESMSLIAHAMAHVGLARLAEQQGAAYTAAQLRIIASWLDEIAGLHQKAHRH